jgi:hypothetical protein
MVLITNRRRLAGPDDADIENLDVLGAALLHPLSR